MSSKCKFTEGEKLLCSSQGLLYDSKCLQTSMDGEEIKYLIHYVGWGKSWDEWVPEDELMEYNDENVERQRKLREEKEAELRSKKSRKRKTRTLANGGASKRKQNIAQNDEVACVLSSEELRTKVQAKSTTSDEIKLNIHNRDEASGVASEELKIENQANSGPSKQKRIMTRKITTRSKDSASKQKENGAQNDDEASLLPSEKPPDVHNHDVQVLDVASEELKIKNQARSGPSRRKQIIAKKSTTLSTDSASKRKQNGADNDEAASLLPSEKPPDVHNHDVQVLDVASEELEIENQANSGPSKRKQIMTRKITTISKDSASKQKEKGAQNDDEASLLYSEKPPDVHNHDVQVLDVASEELEIENQANSGPSKRKRIMTRKITTISKDSASKQKENGAQNDDEASLLPSEKPPDVHNDDVQVLDVASEELKIENQANSGPSKRKRIMTRKITTISKDSASKQKENGAQNDDEASLLLSEKPPDVHNDDVQVLDVASEELKIKNQARRGPSRRKQIMAEKSTTLSTDSASKRKQNGADNDEAASLLPSEKPPDVHNHDVQVLDVASEELKIENQANSGPSKRKRIMTRKITTISKDSASKQKENGAQNDDEASLLPSEKPPDVHNDDVQVLDVASEELKIKNQARSGPSRRKQIIAKKSTTLSTDSASKRKQNGADNDEAASLLPSEKPPDVHNHDVQVLDVASEELEIENQANSGPSKRKQIMTRKITTISKDSASKQKEKGAQNDDEASLLYSEKPPDVHNHDVQVLDVASEELEIENQANSGPSKRKRIMTRKITTISKDSASKQKENGAQNDDEASLLPSEKPPDVHNDDVQVLDVASEELKIENQANSGPSKRKRIMTRKITTISKDSASKQKENGAQNDDEASLLLSEKPPDVHNDDVQVLDVASEELKIKNQARRGPSRRKQIMAEKSTTLSTDSASKRKQNGADNDEAASLLPSEKPPDVHNHDVQVLDVASEELKIENQANSGPSKRKRIMTRKITTISKDSASKQKENGAQNDDEASLLPSEKPPDVHNDDVQVLDVASEELKIKNQARRGPSRRKQIMAKKSTTLSTDSASKRKQNGADNDDEASLLPSEKPPDVHNDDVQVLDVASEELEIENQAISGPSKRKRIMTRKITTISKDSASKQKENCAQNDDEASLLSSEKPPDVHNHDVQVLDVASEELKIENQANSSPSKQNRITDKKITTISKDSASKQKQNGAQNDEACVLSSEEPKTIIQANSCTSDEIEVNIHNHDEASDVASEELKIKNQANSSPSKRKRITDKKITTISKDSASMQNQNGAQNDEECVLSSEEPKTIIQANSSTSDEIEVNIHNHDEASDVASEELKIKNQANSSPSKRKRITDKKITTISKDSASMQKQNGAQNDEACVLSSEEPKTIIQANSSTSDEIEVNIHNHDEASDVASQELKIKNQANSGPSKQKQIMDKKITTISKDSGASKRKQNGAQNDDDDEVSIPICEKPLHAKEKWAHTFRSTQVEAVSEKRFMLEEPDLLENLPDDLKDWLDDDRDMITKENKIIQLPAMENVEEILEDFVKFTSDIPEQESAAREFAGSITKIFNDHLEEQFLCPSEVNQYRDIMKSFQCTVPSKIYGAMHLLRIFGEMDDLLRMVPVGKTGTFSAQVKEFFRFLEQGFSRFFQIENYIDTPSAYKKN